MPIRFEASGFQFVVDGDVGAAAVERAVRPDNIDELGLGDAIVKAHGFEGKIGQSVTAADGDQLVIGLGLGDDEPTAPSIRVRAAAMYRAAAKLDSVLSPMVVEASSAVGADIALSRVCCRPPIVTTN